MRSLWSHEMVFVRFLCESPSFLVTIEQKMRTQSGNCVQNKRKTNHITEDLFFWVSAFGLLMCIHQSKVYYSIQNAFKRALLFSDYSFCQRHVLYYHRSLIYKYTVQTLKRLFIMFCVIFSLPSVLLCPWFWSVSLLATVNQLNGKQCNIVHQRQGNMGLSRKSHRQQRE